MTNTPAGRETFEIVRRGYEPQQVDRRIAALARDLETANQRRAELERRVEELHTQSQESGGGAPYSGLGARIEQILGLAEEEAKELRAAAAEEASRRKRSSKSGSPANCGLRTLSATGMSRSGSCAR